MSGPTIKELLASLTTEVKQLHKEITRSNDITDKLAVKVDVMTERLAEQSTVNEAQEKRLDKLETTVDSKASVKMVYTIWSALLALVIGAGIKQFWGS